LLVMLAGKTRAHFTAEQALMDREKYAGRTLHVIKHQYLLQQLDAFVTRFNSGSSRLNEHSLHFLSDWLTTHILKEDKNFALWLNEHGKY